MLVNVNIHSVEDANGVGGHGTHPGDAWEPYTYGGIEYPGQGDMGNCEDLEPEDPTPTPEDEPTPVPTEEPTPVPTDEPQPTPTDAPGPTPTDGPQPTPTDVITPTDEPTPTEDPTPTPTEEPPTCEELDTCETPTPTPTEVVPTEEPTPDKLPSTGFISQGEIMNGEPWIVMLNGDTTVWAGHNQEDWPAGQWWKLWTGVEFYWQYGDSQGWYTVTYYNADAAVTDVHLIYSTEPDIILVTCRGYDAETNTWAQRLVIYAEASD